jgi:hypothetical protein
MPTSKTTAAARRPAALKPNVPPSHPAPAPAPPVAQSPAPAPSPVVAQAPVVAKGPGLIDNPHAPEFFATSCCGFSIGQGHVTLTFESARCNHFDPNCAMNRSADPGGPGAGDRAQHLASTQRLQSQPRGDGGHDRAIEA